MMFGDVTGLRDQTGCRHQRGQNQNDGRHGKLETKTDLESGGQTGPNTAR